MSLRSQDYAQLAEHTYDRKGTLASQVNARIELGGVAYKVLAVADRPSGYQGAIYQHLESGEIVVAHRGTEFERQKMEDLVKADGGMVLRRTNNQADDAIALTQRARDIAERQSTQGRSIAVTTTGHSLGGTLAQITAHHFDMTGETFNAYGAVSLDRRIGAGGTKVLNHVMAADLVSSGSPHYGQVRVYATERDVDTLDRHGYANNRDRLDLRHPVPAAVAAMRSGSHDMHNFLPTDGLGRSDVSILDDAGARRRASAYDPMIDKFRGEIGPIRAGLTLGLRSGQGLLEDVDDWIRGPLPPGVRQYLSPQASHTSQSTGDGRAVANTEATDPTQPGHPLHSRYCTAYEGVCAIDRKHGREPDDGSRRLAAALAAESTPLRDLGAVVLSEERQRLFAVDAADPTVEHRQRVHVDIATAFAQPLEASDARWQSLDTEQAQRTQQVAQQPEQAYARTA